MRTVITSQQRCTFVNAGLIIILSLFLSAFAPLPVSYQSQSTNLESIPVLAYYYIWFDTNSWDRAKTDYPLLGRYSSDEADVMLQHITWAKSSGISGFIVSWKSTDKLNRRLEQLIRLAEQEDFKLAVIYEGLDFYRNPLPADRIATDLDFFIENFADSPAFDLYEKPVMMWSGTWKFTRDEIEPVTQERRDDLLILATEKNLNGYQRLSDLVDGNAYYWSSVNPDTHPGYPEKLKALGALIHATGGLWIAPAAPGFDARLIGGTSVVERKDGETLRTEMNAALQSFPDAIGLISWNEFSENSHIEPSQSHGHRYLEILADIQRVGELDVPHSSASNLPFTDFDSSIPGETMMGLSLSRLGALGSLMTLLLISIVVIFRRSRKKSGNGEM